MGSLLLGGLELTLEVNKSEDVDEGFALSLWSQSQHKFADSQIFVIAGRHGSCFAVTAVFCTASDR